MKPIIAVPQGTTLPSTVTLPFIQEGDFVAKLNANAEVPLAIVMLTTEELIVLVEKPHLFGADVIALVGAPGGRYDAIWSSYTAALRRVSLETLEAEARKLTAAQETEPTGFGAPRAPVATDHARARLPKAPAGPDEDDDEVTE